MPSCCFLVMVASAYCYNTWQSETLTNDWFDKVQPNTADCACNNLKQYMNMIFALGGLVWERVRIQNGDRQLLAQKPKHNIWGSTAGPCQSAQHKAPSVGKHAVGAAEGFARDASPGTHARGVFGIFWGMKWFQGEDGGLPTKTGFWDQGKLGQYCLCYSKWCIFPGIYVCFIEIHFCFYVIIYVFIIHVFISIFLNVYTIILFPHLPSEGL